MILLSQYQLYQLTQTEQYKYIIMKNHCTTKKLLGGFCCIAIVTILGLLIAYCARLGFGDEIHTQATLGSCRESTTGAGAVKIMSFNTFLIPCIPTAKCQEDDAKEARVAEIGAWFKDREEDIILLQELWSFHDEIRDGMTSAGYCHYVITDRINGSGLAIFSKHPIETSDCECSSFMCYSFICAVDI